MKRKLAAAAVLAVLGCDIYGEAPSGARKSRALIVDEQGMCWKVDKWVKRGDEFVVYHKKGTVIFRSPPSFFILSKYTHWTDAAKYLSTEERYCFNLLEGK